MQTRLLTVLKKKPFENIVGKEKVLIVGKGENALWPELLCK